MMKTPNTIIFLILFISAFGNAISQKITFEQNNPAIEQRIKKDLYVLASDSLQGREAGTPGEIIARDYIVNNYKTYGIKPAFQNDSYIQPFTFKTTPTYGSSNYLKINNQVFELGEDFYPLAYSLNGNVAGKTVKVGYGIIVPEKHYDDYKNKNNIKGKIFIIETSLPNEFTNDSLVLKNTSLQQRIETAYAKGATGIIFISPDTMSQPSKSLSMFILQDSIPVIYANEKSIPNLKNETESTAEINVDIVRKIRTAYNVAAYIDNNAPYTIIIGAHYDHIGWGKEYSRYKGKIPMIHNGADDNGSGTVAVMELARYLKNSGRKKYNYLFINFSAEEEGTIGSIFFTNSHAYDLSKIDYMLNLDMVGRYDSTKTGLDIMGTGTSPLWDTIIGSVPGKGLKIKKTKSGLDGSDQLSFYVKNIPIIFFFTGIHPDYHRPTDDADKINYTGEAEIICYAEKLIEKTDSMQKLTFAKMNEAMSMKKPSLNVTLGVIPDHSFDGKGMRIETVLDGRPAAKAGLLAGDIIIKIGEQEVSEIMTYMKALSSFKKGDKTIATVIRGNETVTKEVQF